MVSPTNWWEEKMNQHLSVNDFNSYQHYVNSIPPLTLEQELQYGKQLAETNDTDAAQKLILHNLRHVIYIARKFYGYGLPIEDLVQEGNIGLMKAIRSYDYTRGYKLITFAIHSIKSEIQMYVLNNWSIVKISSTKPIKKLFFNLRRMRQSTSWMSEDEVQYVAEELSVPIHHVRDMERRMYGRDMSIEVDNDDSEGVTKEFECWNYDPCLLLEHDEQLHANENVLSVIDTLDDRTKDIIVSRYVTDNKATLHELAAKHKVSAERVRQIEVEGIKKMKGILV
jgi:RNA polymerase sigma-32 factor